MAIVPHATRRHMASLAPLVFVAALMGMVACGASESSVKRQDPPNESTGAAPAPVANDGGLPMSDGGQPPPTDFSASGFVLVNASRRVPAFRLCKAAAAPSLASLSLSKPFPTARMPSSSLSGVDILGAVASAPQLELGADSTVLLLPIDEETKKNDKLETGSCRALACDRTGGSCLPPAKLRRVSAYRQGILADSAFSTPGHLLVLRDADDGSDEVYFDVVDVRPTTEAPLADSLRVELHDFSTFQGAVRFTGSNTSFEVPNGGAATLPLGTGGGNGTWAATTLTAGELTASLDDIYRVSEATVPIGDYYRTPSVFALLLLGGDRSSAGEKRALKLLAVPMVVPRTSPPIGDDDAGAVVPGTGPEGGLGDASVDAGPG